MDECFVYIQLYFLECMTIHVHDFVITYTRYDSHACNEVFIDFHWKVIAHTCACNSVYSNYLAMSHICNGDIVIKS